MATFSFTHGLSGPARNTQTGQWSAPPKAATPGKGYGGASGSTTGRMVGSKPAGGSAVLRGVAVNPGASSGYGTAMGSRPAAAGFGHPTDWREEFMAADPLGSLHGGSGGVGGMHGFASAGVNPRSGNFLRIAGTPIPNADPALSGEMGARSASPTGDSELGPRQGAGIVQPQQQVQPSAQGSGSPGMYGYASPGASTGGYQAGPWQMGGAARPVRPRAGGGFLQAALESLTRGR